MTPTYFIYPWRIATRRPPASIYTSTIATHRPPASIYTWRIAKASPPNSIYTWRIATRRQPASIYTWRIATRRPPASIYTWRIANQKRVHRRLFIPGRLVQSGHQNLYTRRIATARLPNFYFSKGLQQSNCNFNNTWRISTRRPTESFIQHTIDYSFSPGQSLYIGKHVILIHKVGTQTQVLCWKESGRCTSVFSSHSFGRFFAFTNVLTPGNN